MTQDEHQGGGASRSTDPAYGTSTATDVSLREYLGSILKMQEKLEIERLFWLALTGGFAWFQIQRRLEILNHENERLLQQQQRTVSQDTYTANENQRKKEADDLSEWRKEAEKKFTESVTKEEVTQGNLDNRRGSIDTNTKIIAVVFSGIGLMVTIAVLILAFHK